MDLLRGLQSWFAHQCNGEWEHSLGVEIQTLDNPGWLVTVDLARTAWAGISLSPQLVERTADDWVRVEVSGAKFSGAGGPNNLAEIVAQFLKLVGDAPSGAK